MSAHGGTEHDDVARAGEGLLDAFAFDFREQALAGFADEFGRSDDVGAHHFFPL